MRSLLCLICSVVVLNTSLANPASAASSSASASPGVVERIERTADSPGHAVLDAAIKAYQRAVELGRVANPAVLTVIDYTRPSTEPRLWVLDLVAGKILHRELVAHGRNSGDNLATTFSNQEGSLMTSLGLFVTAQTYQGQHGYSLRLRGLDPGVNDNAFARAIVIHGAKYVSEGTAKQLGRLGRSWGCPAVGTGVARPLIDLIKDGSVVFAYGQAPTGR